MRKATVLGEIYSRKRTAVRDFVCWCFVHAEDGGWQSWELVHAKGGLLAADWDCDGFCFFFFVFGLKFCNWICNGIGFSVSGWGFCNWDSKFGCEVISWIDDWISHPHQ